VADITHVVTAQPADDEAWEATISRPARQLFVSLRLISGAFGHVLAFSVPQIGAIYPFVLCFIIMVDAGAA
jgi:hypothetical protein